MILSKLPCLQLCGRTAKKSVTRVFVFIATLGLLSACGGGGGDDSSTGGGTTDGAAQVNLAQFAGTYTGAVTASVSVDGGTETLVSNVTFMISPDGTMISAESQQFALNSTTFSIVFALPLSEDDIVCTLEATLNGNIMTDLISGSVSGSGNCVRAGATLPAELSGYSGASRV